MKPVNVVLYAAIVAVMFLHSVLSIAQAPQKVSYQSVIRDATGALVKSGTVSMRISILQGSASGTVKYAETHSVSTNANGLATLEVGNGTPVTDTFLAIIWSNGPYFLKVETDPAGGTSYSITGTSEIMSVPYALHAKTVEVDNVDDADADPLNEIQALSLVGDNLTLSKDGGTVTLPAGADNWGTQTAVTDLTLEGNGTLDNPLKIARQSATTGQALKWNGSSWLPGSVISSGTAAGGDLGGTYPNPSVAKIRGRSISATAPTEGQILKYVGTSWTPSTITTGLILPFENSASYSVSPFLIIDNGTAPYTIAGFSEINIGIYGESRGINGVGVFGQGSGNGNSTGVIGNTGEGAAEGLPGNTGVLGQSNANIGVAGTAMTGTGGYFSSRSGNALFTKGKMQLTEIGEEAGRILTSDADGFATWQAPVSLSLPYSNSASYSATPFSVTNTGTAPYTIAGYSHNNFGIYGKTYASNGAGVNGTGTGANDFSAGVVGFSGESEYTGSPGNAGVSGMANAYIGVSGRSVSGIGGSFSSVSGSALRTAGQVQLTGIGEAANRVLTSDATGFATWQAPVSFTLPYSNSASYSTTPFSITNTGSSLYTIAAFSNSNFGIYGKTNGTNSSGVYGEGTGGDYSIGVAGGTGEVGYPLLPGNAGVLGQSGANIAVAGTANSGTGGYFSSVSGSALRTAGQVQLTGIGEAANRVLTSDATGFATWQAPLWQQTGSDIYYNLGKVGIGTDAPTSMFEVDGNANLANIRMVNNSTGREGTDGLEIGYGSSAYLWNDENTDLIFGTNSMERLSIEANGNIGIGTYEPGYKLDIAGNLNLNKDLTSGAALYCNGSEALWYNGTFFSWGFGGTYNYFARPIAIGTGPAGAGFSLTIAEDAAKPGGGSWATWSDMRLKDIHGNYEKGLREITLLQPVTYSYKKDNNLKLPSDINYTGFIAQDVQKVFPEAVSEGSDGYLTLDANSINVAVINAIKELKAENDKLKTENQELRNEVSAINERLLKLEK